MGLCVCFSMSLGSGLLIFPEKCMVGSTEVLIGGLAGAKGSKLFGCMCPCVCLCVCVAWRMSAHYSKATN